jgi:hypothetical protein
LHGLGLVPHYSLHSVLHTQQFKEIAFFHLEVL